MKELEKQYNKAVKKPANFSIHRPSYMAGGRAALKWALTQETKKWLLGNQYHRYIDSIVIRKELEDG